MPRKVRGVGVVREVVKLRLGWEDEGGLGDGFGGLRGEEGRDGG